MRELFAITFQNLDGWMTSSSLHYSLAFMLERHIDILDGEIPKYLAESIGCKECPAIKAGKECRLNMSRGPMPGEHDPNQDIPQFLKLKCNLSVGEGYRPCMQSFQVQLAEIHEASVTGVKPFNS